MGCDIHLFTEIKINGKWITHSIPRADRNYELFELMAGVRGENSKAIVEPKGLPNDMGEITSMYAKHWEGDSHTGSWFNAQEICILYKEIRSKKIIRGAIGLDLCGYFFGGDWSEFVEYRETLPKEVEDIRFVFWFDC